MTSKRRNLRLWAGNPYPLGATWDGAGVNFALFSEHATEVDLCLFDSADAKTESHRIPLPEQTDMVWHAYLPEARPGQLYGYRGQNARRAEVHEVRPQSGPHDQRECR